MKKNTVFDLWNRRCIFCCYGKFTCGEEGEECQEGCCKNGPLEFRMPSLRMTMEYINSQMKWSECAVVRLVLITLKFFFCRPHVVCVCVTKRLSSYASDIWMWSNAMHEHFDCEYYPYQEYDLYNLYNFHCIYVKRVTKNWFLSASNNYSLIPLPPCFSFTYVLFYFHFVTVILKRLWRDRNNIPSCPRIRRT